MAQSIRAVESAAQLAPGKVESLMRNLPPAVFWNQHGPRNQPMPPNWPFGSGSGFGA